MVRAGRGDGSSGVMQIDIRLMVTDSSTRPRVGGLSTNQHSGGSGSTFLRLEAAGRAN